MWIYPDGSRCQKVVTSPLKPHEDGLPINSGNGSHGFRVQHEREKSYPCAKGDNTTGRHRKNTCRLATNRECRGKDLLVELDRLRAKGPLKLGPPRHPKKKKDVKSKSCVGNFLR